MKKLHNFKATIAMIIAVVALCFAFPANAQTTHTWDGSGSTLTVANGDVVTIATGAVDTLMVPDGAEITITSNGAVDNANRQITLNIAPTATVVWEADYTLSTPTGGTHVLTITGGGNFRVTGGQIISQSTAMTSSVIRVSDGFITVTGGRVSATAPHNATGGQTMVAGIQTLATNTGNIRVEGGEVSTWGGAPAIILNANISQEEVTITVAGGIVKSMAQRAIRGRIVTISGGLVFGAHPRQFLNLPMDTTDVISFAGTPQTSLPTTLNITGDAIVIAWHGWTGSSVISNQQRVFAEGTSTNLWAFPADGNATATWAIVNNANGFVNNRNATFIEIPSVTVGFSDWDSDVPPMVVDGSVVMIASGAEGTLEVPANVEVTIVGEGVVDNANRAIALNIGANATVIWEANYTSSINNAVVVSGGGELVVEGSITSTSTASSGGAIQIANGSITVTGEVSATGTTGQVHGIWSTATNTTGHITVDGGLVSAVGAPEDGGTAIFLDANSAAVHVTVENGGMVRATSARAMRADIVSVADGFVFGAQRRAPTSLPLTADTTDAIASTDSEAVGPNNLSITGSGIVIAWHQRGNDDQTTFYRDSSTNLLALHNDEDAVARWVIGTGNVFGISNNKNATFLAIPGITVQIPLNLTSLWDSNVPPTITEDAEITIAAGATDVLIVPAGIEVTIISEGKVDNDELEIALNIAEGSTVIWKAEYTANVRNVITVTGGGEFVVADGIIINTFAPVAFFADNAAIRAENGTVTVTGGVVSATGETTTVLVSGILSTAENTGNITVDGGTVSSVTAPAILVLNNSISTVTVKGGGVVRTSGERAIRGTTVTIEDGVVFGSGFAANALHFVIAASAGNVPPAYLTIAEDGVAVLWTPGTLREFQRGRNTNLHVFNDN